MIDHWPRDCEIAALREQGMTLQAIGDRYGLSRERVRIIILIVQRKRRWQKGNDGSTTGTTAT